MEVRRIRYASAAGEVGSLSDTTRLCSLAFQSLITGMRPSTPTPGTARSRSSLPLIESSRYSTRNARPTPKSRPSTTARTALRLGVGWKGSAGVEAGVTS